MGVRVDVGVEQNQRRAHWDRRERVDRHAVGLVAANGDDGDACRELSHHVPVIVCVYHLVI